MRLLLDTQVLLWWLTGDTRLSPRAAGAIRDGANDVYISAISAVEIAVKGATGRLKVPDNLEDVLAEQSLTPLPVTVRHGVAARVSELGDPFDRVLVAQARCEELTLVTADRRLDATGLRVLRT